MQPLQKKQMKKWKKPLACALVAVVCACGLTPVLASGVSKAEKEKRESGAQVDVRKDKEAGFVKLEQSIKGEVGYITGTVAKAVDNVVILQPSGSKIVIVNLRDRTFHVSFPAPDGEDSPYVTLEAYADGTLVETKKLKVDKIDASTAARDEQEGDAYTIEGTAVISPRKKLVWVKGTIDGEADELDDWRGDWRLIATAPDGVRHELALADDWTFAAALPFKNRSYSAKVVHLELYKGNIQVAAVDLAHGVPNNKLEVKQDKVKQGQGKSKEKKKKTPDRDDDKDDDKR